MCKKIICFVLMTVLAGGAYALPKQGSPEKELVNMINQIDSEVSLPLFGGLRIERIESGRSFDSSIKTIDSFEDRAERYLETHQLNFSFPEDGEVEDEFNSRAVEETRGKKMKKMLVPLLLLLKLKKAVIVKVMLSVIKFISFKSLAISLLALFFAGATFFKDLLNKKKDHITTAYITGSPLNAEIVHSDWNRNGQAAGADLAYNHYGLAQPF